RKCVDACPTGALEEYKIDARKCISYLTIENKEEEFSKETKKDLSGWVYGCDICQEVCPWNREKRGSKLFTEEKDFYVKSEWKTMSREKLKKLTEEEFLNLVRTSAMQRISYKQFLRNLKSE
ncbi:MAG: tRNA epoxyqueuosine(34) reductase QueG, partial [Leptospiraceae bacterium]|nr:tRNA epoxyqueuosine(34) reductase QueG [Leptospiraceae bacterium]